MTKQNVVIRSDYKLALKNNDRNISHLYSDKKCVERLLSYYSDDKKSMMNMLDYFKGKINKHEKINLVLEDGHYAFKEEYDRRQRYINKQFENSNVWRLVISLEKEFVEKNISWRELEKKLAKEVLPKFFKKMGFEDSKKICYQFSLHMNTRHPHFHIAFLERTANTRGYDNSLQYRRHGTIPKNCIKFLMNEMTLCIERESHFRPLSINLSKDLDELKKYFDVNNKDFILYDKENILLEEKILQLGKKLFVSRGSNIIKYNSIKDEDIKKLTTEIKNEIFSKKELNISKNGFNKSIERMNVYLIELAKRNKIKKSDLSYTLNKEKYLNNYIFNAIVNYSLSHYKKESSKVVDSKSILEAIILKVYSKNSKMTKKEIIKNSFNNNYQLSNEVIEAIKNINREMEQAAEEFYKIKALYK